MGLLGYLLGLLLACAVRGDGTITTHYTDWAGTQNSDNTHLLTLEEKKVDVRFPYILITLTWSQFPDMAIEFYLEFDQWVEIRYHIVTRSARESHLITQMVLDGEAVKDYWAISRSHYHTNSVADKVWLTKGRHFAKVLYNC